MKTLGEGGIFNEILSRAAEAQRLAQEGVLPQWCENCSADTMPRDGRCIWCEAKLR